jgi:hypothetical protein
MYSREILYNLRHDGGLKRGAIPARGIWLMPHQPNSGLPFCGVRIAETTDDPSWPAMASCRTKLEELGEVRAFRVVFKRQVDSDSLIIISLI